VMADDNSGSVIEVLGIGTLGVILTDGIVLLPQEYNPIITHRQK